MDDHYWDTIDTDAPLFDFYDWCEYPYWYEWNVDDYSTEPYRYYGWALMMSPNYCE